MARAEAPTTCATCEVHAESTFRVEGMDCHEEVALIERRLKHLAGLESLSADVIGGRLHVQYDAARLSTGTISAAVADTGMRAWLEHEEAHRASAGGSRFILLLVSGGALAVVLLAAAFGWNLTARIASAIAIATGGIQPARRAVGAMRLNALDMNVLMSVAVIGALIIGEWSEAATVTFLFNLAQHLESHSMDRARQAIRSLMDLAPAEAVVVRQGVEVRIAVDAVHPGEIVRVRPGEKIPLDGEVVAGASDVNQAPITGESLPVDKAAGHEVFAGTINGHGSLDIRAVRVGRDTTLGRVIHLVEAAQAQRAPAQTFVDRFARVYTPAVIGLAILVAIVPPLAGWGSAGVWFYRALVLLVIACPCALVIATPVAYVSALAAGARRGVLIKGGVHLERLAQLRAIAFDKTGTLTHGTPVVVDVIPFARHSATEVLRFAAAVEARSQHPIAAAIVERARLDAFAPLAATDFKASHGMGAEATIGSSRVLVGNTRWLRDRGIDSSSVQPIVDERAARGQTVAVVATPAGIIGAIALADKPRESARDVIDLLRGAGVSHTAVLTGDHAGAARSLAASVGVEDVRAGLLPAEKVDAVRELRDRWGQVGMVGDGVNDAPALAASDVGIAMGAVGSDAALETADVALMGDELARLPFAIRLSRAAVRTVRVNIVLALGVKAAFLAMAIAGQSSLWMAIVADTGMSLLVIANGLRLLRIQ
jgi:Cd2+/Zn2+-exporting ATPase